MDGGEQPLNSHEAKELRRQQKLAERQQQSAQAQDINKKRRTKTYAISASLIILVLAGLWFFAGRGITGGAVVDIGSHPAIGPAGAPVKIIVFGDYQCPFTRRFWQGAFPQILETYKDKIQVAYWPVPTAKHNYDRASAEAAYCANEQGKFWEYANLVFERQGAATDTNLMDYARELQLDADAFWQCYSSNKYEEQVEQDYKQGRDYGVVQTPTVNINEHQLSGDLPFEDYKTFIEYELQNN